jgi:hypothetical protein
MTKRFIRCPGHAATGGTSIFNMRASPRAFSAAGDGCATALSFPRRLPSTPQKGKMCPPYRLVSVSIAQYRLVTASIAYKKIKNEAVPPKVDKFAGQTKPLAPTVCANRLWAASLAGTPQPHGAAEPQPIRGRRWLMRSQGNLWQRNDGQGNKPESFSSHSSAHHAPAESSIKEMILTDCTAERAALLKFCLDDPAKNGFAPLLNWNDAIEQEITEETEQLP